MTPYISTTYYWVYIYVTGCLRRYTEVAARRCGGAAKLHIKATMRIIYMRLSNALASCLFLSYSFLPFFIPLSLTASWICNTIPLGDYLAKVYGNEARRTISIMHGYINKHASKSDQAVWQPRQPDSKI